MLRFKSYCMALAMMLALSACGQEQRSSTTANNNASSAAITTKAVNPDAETILVGSEISYIPFEFKNAQGQPIGFEVDLLNAIAKAEGFNVQFVNSPRTLIEETLNNGKFRIWASSLSIHSERTAKMDMSEPFLDYERAVMVLNKPKYKQIVDAASLKNLTISFNKSSTANARKVAELGAKPLPVDSFYLAMLAVYDGKADAAMGDSRIFSYYQTTQKEIPIRIVSLGEPKKSLGFAVKKGDAELLAKINSGLAKVKADGTLDKLVEKYFGQHKAS